MKETDTHRQHEEGMNVALKLSREEAGINREVPGRMKYLVPAIAFVWSLFQLSIASWLILDTIFIRAIHLGFALLIVFLNYPLLKKKTV